jgi:hypothetical protein
LYRSSVGIFNAQRASGESEVSEERPCRTYPSNEGWCGIISCLELETFGFDC